MKPKSAPTAEDLRYATTVADVLDLLRYGKHAANETEFVRIVEDGEPVAVHAVPGKPKLPGARLVIWIHERQRDGHLKTWRDKVEEPAVGRDCVNAIFAGDDKFFRDMADAVAVLKSGRIVEAGKRAAFVLLILEAIQNKQPLPSVRQVQDALEKRFGAEVDAREIRRWRKTIGVPPPGARQKASSARTGWHRGLLQKGLTKRELTDDESALLLLETVSPELAEKARQFILEN